MANQYAGRNAVKRASATESGVLRDEQVDRAIAAASAKIERLTRRRFYPLTSTKLYRWPQRQSSPSGILYVREDLLAITTLQSEAQNSSPTTIAAADFFLEPQVEGPPYDRIEIDESSTSVFVGGDTPQRSLSVAGRWGYSEDTKPAGTVSSGLSSDTTVTSMVVSDGSLVDVGAQLLIESEQVRITELTSAALGSILIDGALAATISEVSIVVDSGHGLAVGEVMLVGSERMLVEVSGTTALTVKRAFDGSVLAAHSDDTAVHVFRTATIVRSENGTTAATHANSTSISRYMPPADVELLCIAEAIATIHQERAGWGRTVGGGEGAVVPSGQGINELRTAVYDGLKRWRWAAV
jgi:hypothetical protein